MATAMPDMVCLHVNSVQPCRYTNSQGPKINGLQGNMHMKIVTSKQMQALDRETIDDIGIPGLVLMENAGRGTAEVILSCFCHELSEKGALVVAGPGNNGGDGFVIARHIRQAGFRADVVLLAPWEKFRGDALVNLEIVKALEIPVVLCVSENHMRENAHRFEHAGVIVDAVFGTGLGRDVTGRFALAVNLMNMSPAPTVAVDIASGLSADTGYPMGVAVKADITSTMAIPKTGHMTWPGCNYTGDLRVIDIGIPDFLVERTDIRRESLAMKEFASILKPRPADGHKGTFGHLIVTGGSRGKTGAAALAAAGALHSGAGLVTVACPASSQQILASKLTEAMTCGLPETAEGTPSINACDNMKDILQGKKAMVLGPGLGISPETIRFTRRVLLEAAVPMVVDADALTAMAEDMKPFKAAPLPAPMILTPHPGEMARLCDSSVQEIQADRIRAAGELAARTGAIVVLKGARTVTASPDGRICINMSGNPGMGTGGMGDVLSGMAGALLAQGYSAWNAARAGVFAHGMAADMLASSRGPWGWTAMDVAKWLPRVWALAKSDMHGKYSACIL